MKAAILVLCTLTGVVDVYENGVASVVVEPASQEEEPRIVFLSAMYLPPDISEGDPIKFTVLSEPSMGNYCHTVP